MKTNLRKITGFAAIAVFIMALAINVKVTLDDPFAMMNEEALAQMTTNGTATVDCNDSPNSGGLFDTRKCDGCTRDKFTSVGTGRCSYNYTESTIE